MNDHTKKLLFDILESGRNVRDWCRHRTFTEYEADRQLRRAVEREFEIVDDATVWGIVNRHLPQLLGKVEALLQGPQTPGS